MKKLVTLLVALAMVLALGTAAFAAEGDGTEANPYVIKDETISVTIPAGGTVYVKVDATAAPQTLVVDGGRMYWDWYLQIGVQTCNPFPNGAYEAEIPEGEVVAAIVNSSADSEVVLNVTVSGVQQGTMDKPEVLESEFWYGDLSLAAGDPDGYYYQWTALADGVATFELYSVTEGVEADIVLYNLNTYAMRSLSADAVTNEYGATVVSIDVSAGDVLSVQVAVMPDANWNIAAADISWGGSFSYPLGSEMNPILLFPEPNEAGTELSLTFTAPAGTTYYSVFAGGMQISIDGGEPVLVPMSMGRMPYTFCITGDVETEHTIVLTYPLGSMENPLVVENGKHTVSVPEGSYGYFITWIAEADGEVVISLDNATGWSCCINNMTSFIYGDIHWSDENPVVNPQTVTVSAGDELQIIVNTYDPANPWSTPAGDIELSVSYADSDETGDMIGVVVAMLAVSGMGITVLKKKEF